MKKYFFILIAAVLFSGNMLIAQDDDGVVGEERVQESITKQSILQTELTTSQTAGDLVTTQSKQIELSAEQSNEQIEALRGKGDILEKNLGDLRKSVFKHVKKREFWSDLFNIATVGAGSITTLAIAFSKSDEGRKNIGLIGALGTALLKLGAEFFSPSADEKTFLSESKEKISNWVTKRNSLSTLPIQTANMTADEIKQFVEQKKERQKSIEAAEAAFNDLNTYFKTDAILFGD